MEPNRDRRRPTGEGRRRPPSTIRQRVPRDRAESPGRGARAPPRVYGDRFGAAVTQGAAHRRVVDRDQGALVSPDKPKASPERPGRGLRPPLSAQSPRSAVRPACPLCIHDDKGTRSPARRASTATRRDRGPREGHHSSGCDDGRSPSGRTMHRTPDPRGRSAAPSLRRLEMNRASSSSKPQPTTDQWPPRSRRHTVCVIAGNLGSPRARADGRCCFLGQGQRHRPTKNVPWLTAWGQRTTS